MRVSVVDRSVLSVVVSCFHGLRSRRWDSVQRFAEMPARITPTDTGLAQLQDEIVGFRPVNFVLAR